MQLNNLKNDFEQSNNLVNRQAAEIAELTKENFRLQNLTKATSSSSLGTSTKPEQPEPQNPEVQKAEPENQDLQKQLIASKETTAPSPIKSLSTPATTSSSPKKSASQKRSMSVNDDDTESELVYYLPGIYDESVPVLNDADLEERRQKKDLFASRKHKKHCCNRPGTYYSCWNMDKCKGSQFYHRFCASSFYPNHGDNYTLIESELKKSPWFCKICTGEQEAFEKPPSQKKHKK
uniref:PHD-type domain-containing protein n=1 Tax=Panagrolaimus superbus TaxID=310955 RepID=A0A914Z2Z6_9BILA